MHQVAQLDDGSRYQVSIISKHEGLPANTYTLEVYDDETFSLYRQAQRVGEQLPKPTFTITFKHPGLINRTWWVSPPVVALLLFSAVVYVALSGVAKRS